MKETNIVYTGSEARDLLKQGMKFVHNAIAHTLGANGKNTVYNKWSGKPIISNDGVSNGREVNPANPAHRQGAALLQQVLERQNTEAGDGTTSSGILALSIIEKGMEVIVPSRMKLRKQIKEATVHVVEQLKQVAVPVQSQQDLENVATISVEDKEYGRIIAKAITDAGDNGVVQVEEAQQEGITVERVEGYEFAQGVLSPYMFTNPEKMEAVLNNPVIIMTELQLTWSKDVQELFDKLKAAKKNDILIICDEIHPDVVKFAVLNQIKGHHRCVIVKKPMQAGHLEDIAELTGGYALMKDKGVSKLATEYLGTAEKVIIKKDSTIIIGGGAPEDRIAKHLETLVSQVAESENDEHLKQKLQERLAKLTGGVHTIQVGGRTEAEAKYLKLKIDDAVFATKAAKLEGIVPGGGSALYHIGKAMLKNVDLCPGARIVAEACMEPIKQILENSGVDIEKSLEIIDGYGNSKAGFDALNDVPTEDMVREGIIDPMKVTRCAIENASGFAGLFLTTETLITPIEEKENSLAR